MQHLYCGQDFGKAIRFVGKKKEEKEIGGKGKGGTTPPPVLANGEENRIATFSNLSGCSLQFYVAQKFGLPSTFTL